MKPLKLLCLTLLVPFTALTIYSVAKVGYLGILTYHLPSPAGWQVFIDLVIGMVLILFWIRRDARSKGRRFAPYLVITLLAGSFGPLLYLLMAPDGHSASDR